MPYDWKTSKLVQAKMALGMAEESLSNARVLLDHDRETFGLAKKAQDQGNALQDLLDEVDRMLDEYKWEPWISHESDTDGFDLSDDERNTADDSRTPT